MPNLGFWVFYCHNTFLNEVISKMDSPTSELPIYKEDTIKLLQGKGIINGVDSIMVPQSLDPCDRVVSDIECGRKKIKIWSLIYGFFILKMWIKKTEHEKCTESMFINLERKAINFIQKKKKKNAKKKKSEWGNLTLSKVHRMGKQKNALYDFNNYYTEVLSYFAIRTFFKLYFSLHATSIGSHHKTIFARCLFIGIGMFLKSEFLIVCKVSFSSFLGFFHFLFPNFYFSSHFYFSQ